MKPTLKEQYLKDREKLIEDAKQIKTATSYNDQRLYHGSSADSGNRSYERMRHVKQAELIFIEQNRKEILELAANLCLNEIGDEVRPVI